MTRAVVAAVALAVLNGCQSPPPKYGQRQLTKSEYQWYQTMTDWYPNWQEPMRPIPPRGTAVSRMPTTDAKVTPAYRPAPVVDAPPPVPAPAPVSQQPPPRPEPTPAVNPVFDFPDQRDATPAGSQPFRVIPPGSTPTNANTGRPQWYSVQKEDTLSSIAKRFYGNPDAWRSIFQANRQNLSAPDQIKIGMRLRLP